MLDANTKDLILQHYNNLVVEEKAINHRLGSVNRVQSEHEYIDAIINSRAKRKKQGEMDSMNSGSQHLQKNKAYDYDTNSLQFGMSIHNEEVLNKKHIKNNSTAFNTIDAYGNKEFENANKP